MKAIRYPTFLLLITSLLLPNLQAMSWSSSKYEAHPQTHEITFQGKELYLIVHHDLETLIYDGTALHRVKIESEKKLETYPNLQVKRYGNENVISLHFVKERLIFKLSRSSNGTNVFRWNQVPIL